MATVHVRLPNLLAQIMGGSKLVEVQADTILGAIEQLLTDYPILKVHLYDESGNLRPHVNLFHNDTNTRWLESPDLPVQDGDTLTIMQAVSGGSGPEALLPHPDRVNVPIGRGRCKTKAC